MRFFCYTVDRIRNTGIWKLFYFYFMVIDLITNDFLFYFRLYKRPIPRSQWSGRRTARFYARLVSYHVLVSYRYVELQSRCQSSLEPAPYTLELWCSYGSSFVIEKQMPFLKNYFNIEKFNFVLTAFRLQCFGSGSARIRIKKCLLDPDPHGQMRIRIQEVKKPRKCTGSLGKNRTVRIKVRFLL